MGELSRIYYDNWDLELLLNLLATGSGVAPALAIIALFDQVSAVDICKLSKQHSRHFRSFKMRGSRRWFLLGKPRTV